MDADLLDRHDKGLPPEYCKPVAIELGYSEDKITFSFAGHEFHIDRSALTERGTERLGGNDYVCAGQAFCSRDWCCGKNHAFSSQVPMTRLINIAQGFTYEQQNDENDAGGYFGGDIQLLIIPDGDNDETLEGDSLHTSVGLREGPIHHFNEGSCEWCPSQVCPRSGWSYNCAKNDWRRTCLNHFIRQPKNSQLLCELQSMNLGTPGVQYDETNLSELNAFISRYSSLDLPHSRQIR